MQYLRLDSMELIRTLDSVRADPRHELLMREASDLEFNDPELNVVLLTSSRAIGDAYVNAFVDSALLTRKVIREASAVRENPPKISFAVGTSLLEMSLAGLEVGDPDAEHVADSLRNAYDPYLQEEPSIHDLIHNQADLRVDRAAYYAGAAMVVAAYRLTIEEQQAKS